MRCHAFFFDIPLRDSEVPSRRCLTSCSPAPSPSVRPLKLSPVAAAPTAGLSLRTAFSAANSLVAASPSKGLTPTGFVTAVQGLRIWPGYVRMLLSFWSAAGRTHRYKVPTLYVDLSSFSALLPGGRSWPGRIIIFIFARCAALSLFRAWRNAPNDRRTPHSLICNGSPYKLGRIPRPSKGAQSLGERLYSENGVLGRVERLSGATRRDRTGDLLITNQPLYQLS